MIGCRPIGIVLGLLLTVGAVAAAGCGGDGGDDEPATTQPATTPAEEEPARDDRSSSSAIGKGFAEGGLEGTYTYSGSTKSTLNKSDSAERQIALAKRAKKSPQNAAAGCRLFARGKVRQWGPPPPRITARLQGDGMVVVKWRFGQLPASLACKPYRVVIAISKGRPGTPKFTSLVFKYRLHSLRGESRQRTAPYLTTPPYNVGAAGESVAEVQGPPASVRVDR